MASADEQHQEVPAVFTVIPIYCYPRPHNPGAHCPGAAFAFGAMDQLVPWALAFAMSSHPGAYLFAVQVSKMSAPWLLVPFLAGAWQASRLRAAVVGLSATWLAVLAYVAMIVSPWEGVHLTPRTFAFSLASQFPWFAGGLVTGPLYGWLGYIWRTSRSAVAALLAALPVLLEPAALWLGSRMGLDWTVQWPYQGGAVTAEFAELAVGMLLTYAAARAMAHGRSSARA
ncbi:MAG: hypothetical protein ACYCVZ_11785 [Streptosporangiaceae bacterium]